MRDSLSGLKAIASELKRRRVFRVAAVYAAAAFVVAQIADIAIPGLHLPERITAQLIEAASDSHLWAERYDRDLADIFEVQSDVATSIARALQVELTVAEAVRLERAPTRDLIAYELYLRGRYLWNRRSADTLPKAIMYFEQAIAQDPGYALPYMGLADAYIGLPYFIPKRPGEVASRAREAALKALELDSTLAEAHAALGEISTNHFWDWRGADYHFRTALELNPNSATAHQYYAEHLAKRGRFDSAIEEMERARQLDPLSPSINALSGMMRFYARRYDDAIERLQYTLALDPNYEFAYFLLSKAYVLNGMHREAVAAARRAIDLGGRSPARLGQLGANLAFAGRREDALGVLAELEQRSHREYVQPGYIALIHLGLGDPERAIEWLQKGYEDRDYWMVFLKADPMLDALRDDQRYVELLTKVGLE